MMQDAAMRKRKLERASNPTKPRTAFASPEKTTTKGVQGGVGRIREGIHRPTEIRITVVRYTTSAPIKNKLSYF